MKYRHDWSYFFNFIRISFRGFFNHQMTKSQIKTLFLFSGIFRITFFLISLFHLSLTRRSQQFSPLISLSMFIDLKSLLLKIIENVQIKFCYFSTKFVEKFKEFSNRPFLFFFKSHLFFTLITFTLF